MSTPNAERGIAPQRVDFARENYLGDGEFGVTPTNPEFLKYSDNITNLNLSPSAALERRGGIGSADPRSFERGPESHEVAVTYDLIKDPTVATGDALYDGLARQGDELLPDSHTILTREDKTQVGADATVSGNTARPTRLYLYGRGGLISEGAMQGNPSEQQPISVELTYTFQYLRPQQIDQPTSGEAPTYLTLRSTDASDTSLAVEIEDEGAGTSETVNLDSGDATSIVSTSNEYADVDAIYVSGENAGDVVVSINDGSDTSPTEGDEIARVFGTASYDGVESDYGVPVIGTGSRETVGSLGAPENFIGTAIQADQSPYPYRIQSINLSVANNLESTEVADQFGMHMIPGNRELTWDATMFGETASIDSLQAHLQNEARDMDWPLTSGTIRLDQTRLQSPGEVAKEEGQAVMTVENGWTAEGLTFV